MRPNTSPKGLLSGLALASLMCGTATAQVMPNGQPVPPPPLEGAPAEVAQVPGNHWQCYRVASPAAMKPVPIITTDQFGKQDIVLGQPITLCNPTAKFHNGKKFGVTDPKVHLVCYSIIKQPEAKGRQVKTGNQFGVHNMMTGQRTMFCAPSYKKLIGAPEFPLD